MESLNRFTAYRSPRLAEIGKMILDVKPHNRSESDFPISLLKFLNRFTAYSISIELKLGMIRLVINLHNRYENDF